MAVKKKDRTPPAMKFWTPLRIASTVIVLALLAAIGVSSCNSNDSSSTAHLPVVPAVVFDTEIPQEICECHRLGAICRLVAEGRCRFL